MSRSSLIQRGTQVKVQLLETKGKSDFFPAVVAGADDSGIYLQRGSEGNGVFYPWWNIVSIEY